MILDTSALMAIFFNEPERATFLLKIQSDSRRLLSAGSLLEANIVLTRTSGTQGPGTLNTFVQRFSIEVVAFDRAQTDLAREAFRQFGKGRHPAGLNFGDCFSYALAKQTGEPLLFKGDDFTQTDLVCA